MVACDSSPSCPCPAAADGNVHPVFFLEPPGFLTPSFAGARVTLVHSEVHNTGSRWDGVAIRHTFAGARGLRSALRQPSSVVRGVAHLTSSGITA